MGIDDTVACFDDEESLVPYIPVDLQMGQPGTRLLAFDANSGKFLPATVLRVNETDKHFHVSFDGSGNASIEHEDVSLMPIQPLKGS